MKLAILTPSYRPDFDSLARLHRSVLDNTDSDVIHHVIVPRRDLPLFSTIDSARLRLWTQADFLPPTFLLTDWFSQSVQKVPFLPAAARVNAINMAQPWPPIRGWIQQQIVKLAAASRMEADVVALIDSDVTLIRPVTADLFMRGESVRLYRAPGEITAAMDRHVKWGDAARRLLGVDDPSPLPRPQFITAITTWDPGIAAACLARVEAVTHDPWQTAVGRELHFAEYILYGTYVDNFGSAQQRAFPSDRALCLSHWDPTPLDLDAARRFVESLDPTDVAVQVQSTSRTSLEVRDFIINAAKAG